MANTLENKMCSLKQSCVSVRCLSAAFIFIIVTIIYSLGPLAIKIFTHSAVLYILYEIWQIKAQNFIKKVFKIIISFYVLFSMYGFLNLYLLKGNMILLWIIGLVTANDTGAFFVGRYFKGRKLIPIISPNKTWSGFLGGMIIGTLFSYYLQFLIDANHLLNFSIPFCFMMSFSSHFGDLLESAFKRLMDVKDTGTRIPGHGGLLDRLDSFLFVSLILYMVICF